MSNSSTVRLRQGESKLLPKLIEGISPEVSFAQTDDGLKMIVTTKSGKKEVYIPKGPKGDAYELTEEDRYAIAALFDNIKDAAMNSALKSEGYAIGKQNDIDVDSASPYYHNNSKYYMEKAEDAKEAIEDLGVSASTLAAGSSATVTKTVDQQTGVVSLEFGIPKGDKGDQGDQGEKGDPPTTAEIEEAVDSYLDEVITNPDSPPLDRTLSSSSAAAPADMVGELKSAFNAESYNLVANAITKSGVSVTAQGKLDTVSTPDRTICIEAEANKRYRIKKASSTVMRAGCASSSDAALGTTLTSFVQNSSASNAELIVETDDTNKYIYIQLFIGGDAAAYRTIAANTASMIVVEDVMYYINDIETDLSHVVKKRIVKSADFTVTGYYGANGAFSATSGYASTGKIDISAFKGGSMRGQCKGVSGNLACFTFFKSDNTYLSNYMGTSPYDIENFDVEIPETAYYVAFSKGTTAKLDPTYIELNAMQYADQAVKDSQPFEYYVGYGQNDKFHYFSNLVECLWDADSKPNANKVINIAQGTYDVLAGLGGMEHINSYSIDDGDTTTTEGIQPWLTNCKIIGWGKVVLNFILDDNVVRDHYWLFSCLNVRGNIEIENIEIHSKNCRYSIHDESSSNYKKTTRKYKNVKCYQNENGGKGGQAVGSGFSVDTTAEYEGCTFVSGTASPAWTCHSKGRSELLFKDSIFQVADGNNVALGISQEGSVYVYAMISDCFLTNKLLVRDEGNDTTVTDMTKIDLINTHVSDIECGYASTIQEPITSYNTITGEKTVLLAPTT